MEFFEIEAVVSVSVTMEIQADTEGRARDIATEACQNANIDRQYRLHMPTPGDNELQGDEHFYLTQDNVEVEMEKE